MPTFVFPTGTKAAIDEIRGVVGRVVTINIVGSETGCPTCSLDPITNQSTDSFCTTCDGLYWIVVLSGYDISGHVRWQSADMDMRFEGGIIPFGDCKVTVTYSALNLTNVENSISWEVDGKTLYMERYQLKGIRGAGEVSGPNRITVVLKEEERDV